MKDSECQELSNVYLPFWVEVISSCIVLGQCCFTFDDNDHLVHGKTKTDRLSCSTYDCHSGGQQARSTDESAGKSSTVMAR